MKKILLVAAVASLAMVSCKKDYTCECTASSSAGGPTFTSKTTIVGVSKSTAKANCITEKRDYTSGGTTVTLTEDCKLK